MARIILLVAVIGVISMAYELKEAGDFPGSEISQRCPVTCSRPCGVAAYAMKPITSSSTQKMHPIVGTQIGTWNPFA